jgi:hypothetical protein
MKGENEMTIKLTSETVSVLKKLHEVDQSLKIPADTKVLRTKSANNTMMAKSEIDIEFPRDVHIYDIREFNSVLSIVDKPELDFSNDKYIVIKSEDGKQKLRYLEAEASLIKSYIDKDLSLSNVDIELKVSENELDSVLTAASTLRLEYIGFIGDGETVTFSAFNKNNGDGNETNNFAIEIAESDAKFRMAYKLDIHNVRVLKDEGDLTVRIDAKRKISEIETASGKTFWIAFDSKSEFSS